MDAAERGAVATRLPKPTGRYVTMATLGLVAVIGIWAIIEVPGSVLPIAGWVLALLLVCWVAMVRPSLTAYENGLQLTNMVRDVFIPWEHIERVRALTTFQVVTDEGQFSCVAVGRSTRAQIKADSRYADRPSLGAMMLGSRMSRAFSGPPTAERAPSLPEYVEQVVTREADERGRRWRRTGAPDRPIIRTWAVDGVGALVLAAGCLVVAIVS
jgi:hypothetical protein